MSSAFQRCLTAAQFIHLSSTKAAVKCSCLKSDSLQKFVQGDLRKKSQFLSKLVKKRSRVVQFLPFIGLNGFILSCCRPRRLALNDIATKQLIVLCVSHLLLKQFLQHTQVKTDHQSFDYFRAKTKKRHAILKLLSSPR